MQRAQYRKQTNVYQSKCLDKVKFALLNARDTSDTFTKQRSFASSPICTILSILFTRSSWTEISVAPWLCRTRGSFVYLATKGREEDVQLPSSSMSVTLPIHSTPTIPRVSLNISNAVAVMLLILLTFQLFHNENITYKDKSCASGWSFAFWSFCVFLQPFCLCKALLMGQRSGRQETSKKLEMALRETMKAEAKVQNNEEEAEEMKAKVQRLTSVFGVADLKNGNNVLSIPHSY